MSGLLKAWLMKGKKKENRTASGTSLRSMILPEMISGVQLRWSQKRTYPSVRNIRQDQTNFSNANDEMKGEAKIQTRDIWLKACKSFIQMQYPSIATLLHPLFFWLMCQHLKGTFAQCVRKGVRTWDCVRRQDLTEASYDPARSDRLTHACGAKTVRVDVQQVPVSH